MSRAARATGRSADNSLPNFLIIGAMRSGTTALTRYLDTHPRVFMSPTKEIHFFDDNYDKGLDWYRSHFAPAGGQEAIGEATPNYLYDRAAIPRMASVLPDARLIAILRNPVDRAYSHYWQKRSYGSEPLSFGDALRAEQKRLTGEDRERRLYSYLDRGCYLDQLQNVCTHYPRQSLLVLLFEDMKKSPMSVMTELCGFLGLDPALLSREIGRPINSYQRYRSVAVRELSKKLPRVLRKVVSALNTREEEYPAMDPQLRSELLERFRPHNEALASWLGARPRRLAQLI